MEIKVRRANLRDAQRIADFVNKANRDNAVTRQMVALRFSDVGFLLAEMGGELVGMLGWQVENLVARVTDFLVYPAVDRVIAGRALIEAMEEEAKLLQAEAIILFPPPNPSRELLDYWGLFGYERQAIANLPRAWREVAREWNPQATEVILKQLRTGLVNRPL